MSKKYLFTLVFSAIFGVGIIVFASASDIQYPVKELGNCTSEAACKTYCNDSSHAEACLDFAAKYNLMSADEIASARNFLSMGAGPGGCKTKDSCETYCDSVDHIDECVAYAEKNNLMSPQELEQAKKIQAAKAAGIKMPACGSKKQCDTYCSQASHMEECITFAQEAGFMSPQELADSQKVLAAIKAGATPPPCSGKEECDAYCSQKEHIDACINFSVAAGFMTSQEAEMVRKTGGKGPGGCTNKEECDTFCQKDENMMTCAQFAYENGMMSKEDFEMMQKTGGKGPGGCKSKDECENFCKDPANQQTCFDFAKANGMISQEDAQRMEQDKQQFKDAMQNIPPEVYTCLESAVGADSMAKFKSGEAMPPKEMGDKMKECFEKNIQQKGPGAPGEGGNMPPGTSGPGGCKTPEECQKYCEVHPDECKNVQPAGQPQSGQSGQMPQFAPGTGPNQSPQPCEGKNCPPPPSGESGGQMMPPGNQQGQMPPAGQMPPSGGMSPPSGEGIPLPPAGGSTAPGAGGEMTPGVQVPLAPPTEQTAPAPSPAPAPAPAPVPAPSSYLQYSPFGAILNFFLGR